jgi:hypothetical protein
MDFKEERDKLIHVRASKTTKDRISEIQEAMKSNKWDKVSEADVIAIAIRELYNKRSVNTSC